MKAINLIHEGDPGANVHFGKYYMYVIVSPAFTVGLINELEQLGGSMINQNK